ncbi:hypothetical protein Cva_01654 [Caedimonas varicaedens]|uniref:Uncharacterized protein n=1 Tax=Caedimonas varicaedens TaxID=1629334 RepID=A0A0K8MGJ3_9PROT|nr:hypothetical protein Cva_01654 [Caedimonas varicaedens]
MLNLNKYSDPNLIPEGTIARVCLTIKKGGYNDPAYDWTDGYATQSKSSDSIYLDCSFKILTDPYARRIVYDKLGLKGKTKPKKPNEPDAPYDPEQDDYHMNGFRRMLQIVNSAYGLISKDTSESAVALRDSMSFQGLDGLEFTVQIGIKPDDRGVDKNCIQKIIPFGHKDYRGGRGHPQGGMPAPVIPGTSPSFASADLPEAEDWAQAESQEGL